MGSLVSFRLDVGHCNVSVVIPVANEAEDLLLAELNPSSDF